MSICITLHCLSFICLIGVSKGLLISPQPDQERKKLQRQKILMFMYPIYNHNWRNSSTIYVYNKPRIYEIFSQSNKIHREVGRAKDLSAPRQSLVAGLFVNGELGRIWRESVSELPSWYLLEVCEENHENDCGQPMTRPRCEPAMSRVQAL